MARQLPEGVRIVGVASRDTRERFIEFVEAHDLADIIHIADVDGEVWRRFGIVGQPSWVVVEPDGERRTITGALGADGVREIVDDLVG